MSTENQKSKSILDKAIDAVSSRDEKAKLEAALKELQATAQATAATAGASAQTQAEAQKAVLAANQRTAVAESQAKALQERLQQIQAANMQQLEIARRIASEARAATASAPKIIAEHTVKPEETLSQLALKYYGHATEPYWMLIYNTNKDVIGGNPNRIRNGHVIKIPELPPELKK